MAEQAKHTVQGSLETSAFKSDSLDRVDHGRSRAAALDQTQKVSIQCEISSTDPSKSHLHIALLNEFQAENIVLRLNGPAVTKELAAQIDNILKENLGHGLIEKLDRLLSDVAQKTSAQGVCENKYEFFFPNRQLVVSESFADTELAQNNDRPKSLADRVDTATGLRGAMALALEDSVKELNQKISGEKLLVFFDFSHMSIANKAGLGNGVDAVLKALQGFANQAFKGTEFELLRLGGDEFALVLKNEKTLETIAQLNEFHKLVKESVSKKLPDSSKEMQTAANLASVRDAMRDLRKEYIESLPQKSLNHFSAKGFKAFLLTKFDRAPENYRQLSTGELQFRIAQSSIGKKSKVMDFELIAVKIGSNPKAIDFENAIALAAAHKHRNKQRNDVSMLEFPKEPFKRRQADFEVSIRRQLVDAKYQESQNTRNESRISRPERLGLEMNAREALITDNSVEIVSSTLGLVDRKMKDVFPQLKPGKYNLLQIDISGFGIWNNNLGYSRADQEFRMVCEIVKQAMPTASIFRSNGGKLNIMLPIAEDGKTILFGNQGYTNYEKAKLELIDRLNSRMSYSLGGMAALEAERSERQALSKFAKTLGVVMSVPESVGQINLKKDLVEKVITINPEDTLRKILFA